MRTQNFLLHNIAMRQTYEYWRAALTADCVVFGFDEGELKVVLTER